MVRSNASWVMLINSQTGTTESITFQQLHLKADISPTGRQVIGMVKKIGK